MRLNLFMRLDDKGPYTHVMNAWGWEFFKVDTHHSKSWLFRGNQEMASNFRHAALLLGSGKRQIRYLRISRCNG